jgi:endonuclease YncB( thermonuclease family)
MRPLLFAADGSRARPALGPCRLHWPRVVKVQDGDTLTVLVNKTQIRVRLDAIDASENTDDLVSWVDAA